VKDIEIRDSVLTPKQQVDRLTRPGATYFNLNPFDVREIISTVIKYLFAVSPLERVAPMLKCRGGGKEKTKQFKNSLKLPDREYAHK